MEAAQLLGALAIFPFTDTSGTTVTDVGDAPRATTTYGAGMMLGATPPAGFDGAVEFPGGADATRRIALATYNNGNGSNGLTPWAIECVLNLDNTGGQQTLVGFNGTYRILLNTSNGQITSESALGAASSAAGAFPVGSWFHLILGFNPVAGTMFVFVNGSPVTMTDPNGFTASVVMTYLGSFGSTTLLMDGRMAFCAIYGTPILATEATDHYALTGLA